MVGSARASAINFSAIVPSDETTPRIAPALRIRGCWRRGCRPGRCRSRTTFVSLLSAHGVPVEAIALLGHNQTATTELIYRHQIVPALTRGAEVMDEIVG